jgi:hypothetical protein
MMPPGKQQVVWFLRVGEDCFERYRGSRAGPSSTASIGIHAAQHDGTAISLASQEHKRQHLGMSLLNLSIRMPPLASSSLCDAEALNMQRG